MEYESFVRLSMCHLDSLLGTVSGAFESIISGELLTLPPITCI